MADRRDLETADGRGAAFEVELGAGHVERGAESLARFIRRVDAARCGEPSALVVIAGTGYG